MIVISDRFIGNNVSSWCITWCVTLL